MNTPEKTLVEIDGDNELAALVDGLRGRGINVDVALEEALEIAKDNKEKNGKFF